MTGWIRARFDSFDGVGLSYQMMGVGRTVVLLHGFLSDATKNWITPGVASRLVEAGFRVVAPDLRGHGASDAPSDPALWPADVLVDDQVALLAHVGLTDYDLAGYSLGARTAARLMVRGATPRRAILGGMGASGVTQAGGRAAMFEDAIRHGEAGKDPRAGRRVQALLKQGGLNPEAMLGVLSSFVGTHPWELASIATPTLVVAGRDDQDNGSAQALAAMMGDAHALQIPGDHISAVSEPELSRTIVQFLTAPDPKPAGASA